MHGPRFYFPHGKPTPYTVLLGLLVCAAIMTEVLWVWIPKHAELHPTVAHPFSVRFQSSYPLYVSTAIGWLFYLSFFGIFASIVANIVMLHYYETKGKAVRGVDGKQDWITELHLS